MKSIIKLVKVCKTYITAGNTQKAIDILLESELTKNKNEIIIVIYRFREANKNNDEIGKNSAIYGLLNILDDIISDSNFKSFRLPARPALLIGRNKDLINLHKEVLKRQGLVLLSGFGGIGKSSLVMEYVNNEAFNCFYENIAWVTVNNSKNIEIYQSKIYNFSNSIINSFISEIPYKGNITTKSIEDRFKKSIEYLSTFKGINLIVIDNANDINELYQIEPYLTTLNWKILITTRIDTTDFFNIKLSNLTTNDCIRLFSKYCRRNFSKIEIESLLSNISYHTILVEILAKTLQRNAAVNIEDLIISSKNSEFDAKELSAVPLKYKSNGNIESNISDFLTNIYNLNNLKEEEIKILRFFSLLPSKEYSFNWLKYFFIDLENNYKHKERELFLGNTLNKLVESGIIIKSSNDKSFSFRCHPIIQFVTRKNYKPNSNNCAILLEKITQETTYNVHRNPIEQTAYLSVLEGIIYNIAEEDIKVLNLREGLRYCYWVIGDYNLALEIAKKNVTIAENILSPESNLLAETYFNIAVTYERLNDFSNALKFNLKALSIREKIFNSDDFELAVTYNNIAQVYRQLLDYDNAILFDERAITIKEKKLGFNHPSLAISYCNHAITHYKLEKYQEALILVKRSIEIREQNFDKEHPELGTSYYHLAICYFGLKDFSNALWANNIALNIWKKAFSKSHPYLIKADEWNKKITENL